MVVIAVLLLVAIVALVIGVFVAETEGAGFEVLEESFAVDGGAIFAAGVLTGLALVGTLWMLRVGVRRSTIRRREIKELRTAHQRQQATLEKERLALEAEKEELRSRTLVRPYIGQAERPPERPPERPREAPERRAPAEPRPPERRPPFGPPPAQPTGPGPSQGPPR